MKQLGLALSMLAVSTLAMEYSNCKNITCGPRGDDPTGNCVTVTSTTVTLNPCPTESYCIDTEQFQSDEDHTSSACNPNPDAESITCPNYHTGQLDTYIDYCCVNEDCASNNCDTKDNQCIGIPKGEACESSESCEPGLFCSNGDSGTCITPFSEYEACTDDYQCEVGWGCFYGYCYEYWSIENGNRTEKAKFCKSGYMKNYYCDSLDIYVGNVKQEAPWSCTIGDTCTYTWTVAGVTHDQADCECDGTGSTSGFCPIRGYPTITGFDDDFYEKFQYDESDCAGDYAHITDLDSEIGELLVCNSIDSDGYDYYFGIMGMKNTWSLYSSGVIDSCAKKMGLFNPDYEIDTWDSAEFLAFSAILILFS